MLAEIPDIRISGKPITIANTLANKPAPSAAGNTATSAFIKNWGNPGMNVGFNEWQQVCHAEAYAPISIKLT